MSRPLASRPLWLTTGVVSLGLGALGAVLPLLPTTPFVLLAAFAFARSSPRLSDWLLAHRRFGPLILDWRHHGSIARPTKAAAVLVILATPAVSVLLGASTAVIAVQAVVLAVVAAFILTRPDPPRDGV